MSKNNLAAQTKVVDGIKEKMSAAHSFVLLDYRGLTVAEVTELRKSCREQGVEYVVIKNTMLHLAAKDLNIEGLDPHLVGPTAVASGMEDAVAPAKVLVDFIKKTKKTELKCGIVDGQYLDVAGIQALAELPPKEVLIAKIMGSLNAPITNFVGVLSATLRSVVYALDAVRQKKENE